jgi:hypothetical protein
MAEVKAPFGLSDDASAKIDWKLALKRIRQDVRTDFVYSPHLSFIYRRAGNELIHGLTRQLKAGTFSPGIPITIEVPKSFRIRVAVSPSRLGPTYSRPGSILLPFDRLLYQGLSDQAARIIRSRTDAKRSFSHVLGKARSANMFRSTRTCWNRLQRALAKYAKPNSVSYILKIDVANFFGAINLHTLINELEDSGYEKTFSSRLEAILISYAQRSSRGILQGMYPSDLLGNYYLTPIDRFLKEFGIRSARYVDDIYIFIKDVDHADRLLRELIPTLRGYDLVLNEAKSTIMPKSALITEEPDLDALFADAIDEVSQQLDDEDIGADYGFQSEWDEDEDELDKEDLQLRATMLLFDSLPRYPGHEENIERFCLPIFTKAGSDHALRHVLESFKKRPAMAQIYSSYLTKFIQDPDVLSYLFRIVGDVTVVDWQKMWVVAALSQADSAKDRAVKTVHNLLKDGKRHETLRAVAAIYVGQFGDHARRKDLTTIYPTVTSYVQAAIYYASHEWPAPERRNAKFNWSANSDLHKLLTKAMD